MQNYMIRNGLVLTVMVLFICISVFPISTITAKPLPNDPPVCEIESITPHQPIHGETVTFIGKAMDPENGVKLFYWDVDGDGSWEVSGQQVSGSGWVYHTYVHTAGYSVPANQNSKNFNVILKVYDEFGDYDIDNDTITVTAYPVADADGPYFGNAGDMITFNGSESYDPNGHIVNWTWDYGDGNMGYGEIISHSYQAGGNYTVNLTVTDNLSGTGYNLTTAYVNNPPDIPIITGPSSGKPGVEYTYCINASDPDNDTLFVLWNWDDGTSSGWLGPYLSGTEVCDSHTWNETGTYTISATVRDEYGESVTAYKEVTMPRDKAINTPFLNFLQSHPNMFPILQRLLQRLGLQ